MRGRSDARRGYDMNRVGYNDDDEFEYSIRIPGDGTVVCARDRLADRFIR